MKIRSKFFLVIILLGFFNSFLITAQNESKKILLRDVLTDVEKQFKVQFNYAEETILDIYLIKPAATLNLNQTINYLQKESDLQFTILDARFILIKQNDNSTICGFIKQENSLIPIALASIQVGTIGTVADKNGFFELTLNNKNEGLEIRALGYRTVKIDLKELDFKACMTVFLQPEIQALSEVYITNYITKGISKLNDGTFSINIEEFDILPGLIDVDVLQSIQAFPGIQSVSETVSNINIRGGSHDQNLILWDNIKMYQSGHFFGLISMYNPQITQKVSLYKNGTDASLSDGVSGTISMFTEKNLNNTFKGSLGLNLIDANGFADIPLGSKSSIQIAARKSISDFTETPTYDQFFNRISQDNELQNEVNSDQHFDFYDTSFRWIYKISDADEIRVNFINVSNELVFNENASTNNINTTRESSITQNSIAGAINYKRIWNSKFNSIIEVYETDYKLEAINSNINESQRFLQKNQVSETSAKLITNLTLNKNLNLQTGYQFVETEITNLDDVDQPRYKLLISEVLREHSIFSQLTLASKNKRTHLDLGLRYNYIDKFQKHIFEPRFSYTQILSKHISVELLGEFKHQNTSQIINFQNDFLGIEKRRWQLSNNKDIPVIQSKQISLGFNFKNNSFLVSIEPYYKYIKGITSQSQGFQNQYEFVKSNGSYDVYGLDLLLRKQLKRFNLWLSYSFMDNKYAFPELEPNHFPSNFDVSHAITFGSAFVINKFKFAAGFNWHSGKAITKPVTGNEIVDNMINYEPTNSSQLDSYLRIDLSALYYINISNKVKGQFGASIWNIMGTDNIINKYYRLNNNSVIEINELSLSFTPNVSARFIFN